MSSSKAYEYGSSRIGQISVYRTGRSYNLFQVLLAEWLRRGRLQVGATHTVIKADPHRYTLVVVG